MKIVAPVKESKAAQKHVAGKQIQNLADLLCGIGGFGSILYGMYHFSKDNIFIGIIVIAIGFYVSWASTRCLQGFGELVEDTTANLEVNKRILDILESQEMRQRNKNDAKQKEPEA